MVFLGDYFALGLVIVLCLFYFDGKTSGIRLPDYPELRNNVTALTAGAWIKPENTMPKPAKANAPEAIRVLAPKKRSGMSGANQRLTNNPPTKESKVAVLAADEVIPNKFSNKSGALDMAPISAPI